MSNTSLSAIRIESSYHSVMLSGTMWSRNIFHKLTGGPSTALRVTECNRDCILIHLRMRLGCLRTFIFSNAPSCFDSALHDSASKPSLPPCAKIKTVARFSNNSPGKQAKKSPPFGGDGFSCASCVQSFLNTSVKERKLSFIAVPRGLLSGLMSAILPVLVMLYTTYE